MCNLKSINQVNLIIKFSGENHDKSQIYESYTVYKVLNVSNVFVIYIVVHHRMT